MKVNRVFTIICIVFIFGQCTNTKQHDDFIKLIDGNDLNQWIVKKAKKDSATTYWRIHDSIITANSIGDSTHDYVWLMTKAEYDNFHLKLKFRPYRESPGNTGIQIRSRYDDETEWLDGPQIDIHPPGSWRTGMMWDETRGNKRWIYPDIPDTSWVHEDMVENPPPLYYAGDSVEWNQMEIIAHGTRIKAKLNDRLITDLNGESILNDHIHQRREVGMNGHICLQIHKNDQLKIDFKDILIKNISEP